MRTKRILVACEESQRVCTAFRERGHEAYSCDIIEPSGNHPEWHILGDALAILNPSPRGIFFSTMDGGGAPCSEMGLDYSTPTVYIPHQCGGTASLQRA